jgi:hypothetical protein
MLVRATPPSASRRPASRDRIGLDKRRRCKECREEDEVKREVRIKRA